MDHLSALVEEFVQMLSQGRSLDAMARFYDPEVIVFENRAMARAGRTACLAYEQEQLQRQSEPPTFKLISSAVNAKTSRAFLEYVVRFTDSDGRPYRLEQVAVQEWSGDTIVQERFYYEGIVDEGDAQTYTVT